MDFSSINPLGIVAAVVVGFVTGALWFSPKTFFPMWWRAMGKPHDEIPGGKVGMGVIFSGIVGSLAVQSIVLWSIISGLYGDASIAEGVLVGAVLGVAIVATSALGHRMFAGDGWTVWALEVGNDIAALALMGAVVAAF